MAAKAVGAVKTYARQVPADAKTLIQNTKNIKSLVGTHGVMGTAKTFVKNKAFQVGAGSAALAGGASTLRKNDK